MNPTRTIVFLLTAGLLCAILVTRHSSTSHAMIAAPAMPAIPADTPVPESETNSTKQTSWGWYYSKTAEEINEMGKQSNLRPITITSSGQTETNPHFNVLFVRNAGVYKVDEWQVVASRTQDNVSKLSSNDFRKSLWRVSGVAWHRFQPDGQAPETRLATILVRDNLFYDYDVRAYVTQSQLQDAVKNEGIRVVSFDSFRNAQGQYQFAAVVVPNKGEHYKNWAWLFQVSKNYIIDTAKKINDKPFRITDIDRRDDGKYNALLVEAKGEATHWYSNLNDDTIYNDVLRRHGTWTGAPPLKGGVRFIDIVAYYDADAKGTRYELLTMENGVGEYPIARDNVTELKSIDDAFIRSMSRNGVPGASFALAKNGKVIYRAAYGYSTMNPSAPATLNTRGRLASISKTLTAAAIMKLVEGGLDLDAKVFGPTGILKDLTPFSYSGYKGNNVSTLNQITVRHLLTHTGGWDRGTSGDPSVPLDTNKFSCNGASTECEPTISEAQHIASCAKLDGSIGKDETRGPNAEEVIRWMMKPDDPDFLPKWAPGTKQVYSNFGYTVLQKIIEVRSKQPYADYIKSMLSQMGVTFAIGHSMPEHALANEWTYYDVPGATGTTSVAWSSKALAVPISRAYFYDMNTMLGHGGWVASTEELVKFASKLDSTAPNPWIKWATFRSMMVRPAGADPKKATYYGLNWGVDPNGSENDDNFHYSHGGALTGARSLLLKGMYERKLSLAYLFNSGDENGEVGSALNEIIPDLDDHGVLHALALTKTK